MDEGRSARGQEQELSSRWDDSEGTQKFSKDLPQGWSSLSSKRISPVNILGGFAARSIDPVKAEAPWGGARACTTYDSLRFSLFLRACVDSGGEWSLDPLTREIRGSFENFEIAYIYPKPSPGTGIALSFRTISIVQRNLWKDA